MGWLFGSVVLVWVFVVINFGFGLLVKLLFV